MLCLVAAAVALGAAPAARAGAPVLLAVRHSVTPERTRLVLDLSEACQHRVRMLPDSTGLVVTVPGANRRPSVGAEVVGRNHVRTVNAFDGADGVDVIVDVDAPLSWSDFTLPARSGRPYRIVVDLAPSPSADVPRAASGSPEPAEPVEAPTPAPALPSPRTLVVAIDAGHGGYDAGANGRYGLVEKKLTLDLARRTAEILNRDGSVRAVLTRDSDVYLTLPARNEIAEKKHADVFVSIHLNSAPSRSARGAEIYFVAPSGAARAAKQAYSSGQAAEEFGLSKRGDANLIHMLLDVNQQAILARSEQLAESILEGVRDSRLLPTRAVKQKSFSVLRTIATPSVLVEAGFLTNSSDAKLLRTPDGRDRIARAIAGGIVQFNRTHPPVRTGDANGRAIVHHVQRGDTLWDLSRRYRTTVARLRELNGLHASQDLHVGQDLVVRPGR